MTSLETVYGESQRAMIQQQLDRLLENPHFSNSRRFPSFLRYIVQEELEGRGDHLKERTLGIEVFGRDPGYDTTSDPIVRVTAAEIRKRIAQYYQDSDNPDELRISLPPGSYVPRFEWPKSHLPADLSPSPEPPAFEPAAPSLAGEAPSPLPGRPPAASKFRNAWLIAAAVLVVVLATGAWSWIHSRPSTLDRFWAPVLDPGNPVAVCFPQSSIDGITLRDAVDPCSRDTWKSR